MSAWTRRHTDGKVVRKIVPPRPRIPWWKGQAPIPKRSTSPRATSTPHGWIVWKCLTPKGRLEKRTWRVAAGMSQRCQHL